MSKVSQNKSKKEGSGGGADVLKLNRKDSTSSVVKCIWSRESLKLTVTGNFNSVKLEWESCKKVEILSSERKDDAKRKDAGGDRKGKKDAKEKKAKDKDKHAHKNKREEKKSKEPPGATALLNARPNV